MRKTITPLARYAAPADDRWLNLDDLADVQVSSEDPAHPIEGALLEGQATGWRAAMPGEQTIRLGFSTAQPIRRIHLRFAETGGARTQEYVLRWSSDGGTTFRDIVRQQWNFSPDGSTSQIEDHHVELPALGNR
jgi:hypothetical protein